MAKQPVLTPQSDDFPRWYQDVINKAELADNGPVRGTMVIRPYGYAHLGEDAGRAGRRASRPRAENAYFPLFIPKSFLTREAEHVEGFAPSWRSSPTPAARSSRSRSSSAPPRETIIGEFMAKWIQSYRDLPLLINQWANVVRWELRTRLVPAHHRVPLAGGPHRPRQPEDDAAADAARILLDVYADF